MSLLLMIVTTILVFCTIYPPQVLLPWFADRYAISQSQAALLTAATLVPLSVAPLSYGYILESMPAVRLLRRAILGLALTQLAFVLAELTTDSFGLLVAIRLGQGLLLPAAMTSLLTYLSTAEQGARQQRRLSIYVAATIVGGYAGRLLAGLTASTVGWRFLFYALAAALLLNFVWLGRLKQDANIRAERPHPRILLDTALTGKYAGVYLMIFCTFFVFAGLLNYLPFRLTELWQERPQALLGNQTAIGAMYSGYLVGVAASLGSRRIADLLGGTERAIGVSLVTFFLVLLLMITTRTWLLFGALVLFCGTMFLTHALAVGLVNRLGSQNKGVVNGLYVAFYYSGGVLGSYLPGLVYERLGWNWFIYALVGVAGLGLIVAFTFRQIFGAREPLLSKPESIR